MPAAASASNTLPLAPTAPTGVACWFGSRLKVSKNRPTAPFSAEAVSPYPGGDGDCDVSVTFSLSSMTEEACGFNWVWVFYWSESFFKRLGVRHSVRSAEKRKEKR